MNAVISRVTRFFKSKVGYIVPALVVLAVSHSGSAYAMDWPPDASDVAALFAGVVVVIGGLIAAAVTAGLTLYGGWQGLMAALSSFSKVVSKAFGR
jgi:hypothetical protein